MLWDGRKYNRYELSLDRRFKMEQLLKLTGERLNEKLVQIMISSQRNRGECTKVRVRPVFLRGHLVFQSAQYIDKKVIHTNYNKQEMMEQIKMWMTNDFKQFEMVTTTQRITALVNKKGKAAIKTKQECTDPLPLTHNRTKHYIMEEGKTVPFLVDLGIMTKDGKIVKSKYDKFRQINRYLEFVEDILEELPKDRELTIIDFGCGKSYLTFALYYYLKILKAYDIRIIGLDLKKDVIEHCGFLAEKYQYDKLTFIHGDIESFEGVREVDMVVTLHACDTATDYALYKASMWGAKVIFSVPCCQHELNGQMKNDVLEPILKYGLMKERFAAIATDCLRAQLLELQGYRTQILEFIEMEHTPKNVLIRAVKTGKKAENWEEYLKCRKFLNVKPTLETLLFTGRDEE